VGQGEGRAQADPCVWMWSAIVERWGEGEGGRGPGGEGEGRL